MNCSSNSSRFDNRLQLHQQCKHNSTTAQLQQQIKVILTLKQWLLYTVQPLLEVVEEGRGKRTKREEEEEGRGERGKRRKREDEKEGR